jgi:outer membrane autotransporter protein
MGIFAIESPEFILQNDAFSVYTSGYDFKTDYLFGDHKGFYTGIQLTYTKDEIKLKEEEGTTDKLRGLNIGLRAGYRFMFGKKENQYKGFYLTPWVALMYNPSAKTIMQGTHEYKQASWVPFPTFHLGWRF